MRAAIFIRLLVVPVAVLASSASWTESVHAAAPVLNQPSNMTVQEGCTADQTITASDPDGDPLTFSKIAGPAHVSVSTTSPTTGNVHLAPGFGDQGTASSTLAASDGVLSDSKSFTITVPAAPNPPPSLDPVADMTVDEGATANQAITGSDPGCGGGTVTFAKASGPAFMTVTTTNPGPGTATGNIHLAPGFTNAGTYSATVRATDKFGASLARSFTITVNDVNRAPTLNTIANMTVGGCPPGTADQPISATDPDGDAITFTSSGPSFMTLASDPQVGDTRVGRIHLAPPPGTSGTFSASVTATAGGESDTKFFTITITGGNCAPTLSQPANMTVVGGFAADQTITATDPDFNPLVFSKVSGPTFVTVTTTSPGSGTGTGNVHLAPGFTDMGTSRATVRASDGSLSDDKSFTITVCPSGPPPLLAQPANMTVNEAATANQTLTATDPDGNPLTFSKAAGPTFMTVTTTSPGTGTAMGNVNLAPGFSDGGTFQGTVSVSDGNLCGTNTKSFTITVNQVCRAPILAQPANMTVAEGATANQTLAGTSPEGAPMTFAKVSGPTYVTVTTTSATTGNIHLAPGFSDEGTATATIAVSVGGICPGTDTKSFTIMVNNVSPGPNFAQPADMTVDEGATADQTIMATDPDGDPLTFAKVAGPVFMTVTTTNPGTGTASGNIHLAPNFADSGTYSATVRASDASSSTDKSFTIVVTQICSQPPRVDLGGPYQGFVNVPIQFDGSGSSDPSGAPLTFAWDFGDGATAAGVMPVHTYTVLGTYNVTLTVTGECGSSTGSTIADIREACDAFAFTRGGNRTIRLNSGRPTACAQIEPQGGCYPNEDVILSSILMKYTGGAVTEIHAIADKTVIDSDTNGDGIAEITACFRKEDLRQLFSGLPGGQSTPIVTLEGNLTTGGRFQTSLELRVISGGGTSAAMVSPNPFNPAATLTFTTARPGRAKVELFDVGGRLVRTILDEPSLGPGLHEVRIEGRGQRGESLASGIYFIRGISAEGAFTKAIAILK